jgi:hypothetical protein
MDDISKRHCYTSAMPLQTEIYQPGKRVRVIQQVPQRDRTWAEVIEGVITRYQQAETGSWFAHGRHDKLWLDRLELRLDDGEITVLNLDQYTVIEEAPGGEESANAEAHA